MSLPAPTGPPPPGSRTVVTDDGVRLHVEVDGDEASPLTVVFAHGFTARLVEWDLQRAALRDRARLVFFDQRGHGRSACTPLPDATIGRTGRDLGEVLDATTPTGPVVLAGHSMGGMSVMALARQRPELFGDRVVGVFLLATSAGGLVETGLLGLYIKLIRKLRLLSLYLRLLQLVAPLLERFRRRGTRARPADHPAPALRPRRRRPGQRPPGAEPARGDARTRWRWRSTRRSSTTTRRRRSRCCAGCR